MSERSEYIKGLHSKENVGRLSKMLGLSRATILKIPTKDLDKLVTKVSAGLLDDLSIVESVANALKKNKGGMIDHRKKGLFK